MEDKERDLWETMIEDLRGTTQSIATVCDNHDRPDLEDSTEFLAEVDQQIFQCECCGWWCVISEMTDNGDWQCTDCTPNEEGDDYEDD